MVETIKGRVFEIAIVLGGKAAALSSPPPWLFKTGACNDKTSPFISEQSKMRALGGFYRLKKGLKIAVIGPAAAGIRTGISGIRTVFPVPIAISG